MIHEISFPFISELQTAFVVLLQSFGAYHFVGIETSGFPLEVSKVVPKEGMTRLRQELGLNDKLQFANRKAVGAGMKAAATWIALEIYHLAAYNHAAFQVKEPIPTSTSY